MEVTSAGVQRAYVMVGSSVVAQLNPNGQFYWLHLDHLGSGRKMTDTSGTMVYRAEFDPYGKLLYEWSSPSNLNTKKFTGYERDSATNLDYAQARMYASDWGRFMSPDPMGLGAARLNSPKSLNRYAYVEGNPINYNDPSGLFLPAPTPVVLCGATPTIWCPGGSPANIQQPPTTLPTWTPPNWSQVLPPQQTLGDRVPLPTLLNAQMYINFQFMKAFLGEGLISEDCQKNVIDRLSNDSTLKFDIEKFRAFIANGAQFYDGTQSNALYAGTITTASAALANGIAAGTTVAQRFANTPGVNAETSILSSSLVIFFRPNSISNSSQSQNMSLLFHEALHGFGGSLGGTSYFDSELQRALRLTVDPNNTRNITDHIRNNCF